MDFFYMRFLVSWTCWLIFADKARWREIAPVSIFASLLGVISDHFTNFHITYWEYYGNHPKIIMVLLDDFEIYAVVTYLYIQWLPKRQRLLDLFTYIFPWTLFAVLIEYIHINTGHMAHHHGWTFWYSYVADWILFLLFYMYHKIFHFEKLSR
ncbi:hypothetical protein FA11_3410 [Pelosinus fermentans A11]|uniref:Uncharacterized protein n=2 Tax=Sporomusaceae TaxID=1843490 RepID=I9LDR0_9FIRM|nr:hypothetical protein FB4_3409 [Pelosinus fermentans B4]EIW24368.1 hypothetical protein FA11_3410 [Pelosinus fermentans A11]